MKVTGMFECIGRFIIVLLIKVSQLRFMFVLYIYIYKTSIRYIVTYYDTYICMCFTTGVKNLKIIDKKN